MEPSPDDPLRPELKKAKAMLAGALEEACSADVDNADTGELIKVEEMLTIASEAAKKAISIRRKLRHESEVPRGAGREVTDEGAFEAHRVFADAGGVEWDVFAVRPSADIAGRSRLPEPFREGWLAFESVLGKRRLAPVPEGWQVLPVEELRQLCARADPVRQRLPPSESRPGPQTPEK